MSLVPTVRQEEHYKIEKQQEYKRIQQEVEVARRRKKATKEYEDRLYYWLLYKSDYRWETAKEARTEFKDLPSKTQQLKAVKLQINMRVLGCGWDDLYPKWTDKGCVKTPDELLEHLCTNVIPFDRQNQEKVPPKPKIKLPSKKDSKLQMGTATRQTKQLQENDFGERKQMKTDVKD